MIQDYDKYFIVTPFGEHYSTDSEKIVYLHTADCTGEDGHTEQHAHVEFVMRRSTDPETVDYNEFFLVLGGPWWESDNLYTLEGIETVKPIEDSQSFLEWMREENIPKIHLEHTRQEASEDGGFELGLLSEVPEGRYTEPMKESGKENGCAWPNEHGDFCDRPGAYGKYPFCEDHMDRALFIFDRLMEDFKKKRDEEEED